MNRNFILSNHSKTSCVLSCRMSSGKTINELASIKNSVSLDVLGVTSGASNAAIHGNDLKSPHATPRESMINQSRDSLSATESEVGLALNV